MDPNQPEPDGQAAPLDEHYEKPSVDQAIIRQPDLSEFSRFDPRPVAEHRQRLPRSMVVLPTKPPPDPPITLREDHIFDFEDGLRLALGIHDLNREEVLVMHVVGLDAGGHFSETIGSAGDLHRSARRHVRGLFSGRLEGWELRTNIQSVLEDGLLHHIYPVPRQAHARICRQSPPREMEESGERPEPKRP